MTGRVLTAESARNGSVVFLGTHGWVDDLQEATVAVSGFAARALEALGRQAEVVNEVVDARLIEVAWEGGFLQPVALHERARLLGPAIRPHAPSRMSVPA